MAAKKKSDTAPKAESAKVTKSTDVDVMVTTTYRDKYTGMIVKAGTKLTVSANRYKELADKNKVKKL